MRAAATPSQRRPDARLLLVDADGRLHHTARAQMVDYLRAGDLLVANDAATIPASLTGIHERSRQVVEIRLAGRRTLAVDDVADFTAIAFGAGDHRTRTEDRQPPPALRSGDAIALGPLEAIVRRTLGHARLVDLHFAGSPDVIWAGIARHGKPIQYAYLDQPLAMWDVWTRVAALPVAFEPPSAGFAIDWKLLRELQTRGIEFATLTHAAGLSSTGDPELDGMLPLDEPYHVPATTVHAIARTWARGGRVIALGTTVVRALEHAASRGTPLRSGAGLATQRIGPLTGLRVIDAIITGAHEPGTSHHELLRAFSNDVVLRQVSAALEGNGYRTHEFGDSVFIERGRAPARRQLAMNVSAAQR